VTVHASIWTLDRVRLFGTTYLGTAIYHLTRLGRRADVLHAHHLYLDAVAALLAGRIRRVPVVAKMVGAGPGGDLDRLRQTTGGSLLLKLLRTLDVVIAPSPSCRVELLAAGFPAERIRVIANGVDTAAFRPEPTGGGAAPAGVDVGPVVVFTGRLIEAKGLLEFLEAWPLPLREVPRAHLVLVGDGTDREALCARARALGVAERVHLAGWVEDVVPFLWAADAFALPSHTEGMPNGALEAMATGLPCVATSVGAVAEVLDGGAGILVPPGHPSALAEALTGVLGHAGGATRLGAAARARIESRFTLEQMLAKYEVLYRSLSRKGTG